MIADHSEGDGRLLMALAEQLKVPLMQISKLVELDIDIPSSKQILETTNIAFELIDGYILGNNIKHQNQLAMEPISISAIMQDVKDGLKQHASNYRCNIELDIAGKYGPIMGNYKVLKSAFTCLGYTYIESQTRPNSTVTLSVYGNQDKIRAGIFDESSNLSVDSFRRAKTLKGTARQPFVDKAHSSAAGFYIADTIFQNLSTNLKLTKHHGLSGLSIGLIPSKQLKLV